MKSIKRVKFYQNPQKNTPSIASILARLDGDEFRIVGASPAIVGDLVKTYKFEHQPAETAMQGRNLRYVSAIASFRAGKSKNGNYRLRQNRL
jgi:hypothetical protein